MAAMTHIQNKIVESVVDTLREKCGCGEAHTTWEVYNCWEGCPLKGFPCLCEFIDPRCQKYLPREELAAREKELREVIGNYLLQSEKFQHITDFLDRAKDNPGTLIQCNFVTAIARLAEFIRPANPEDFHLTSMKEVCDTINKDVIQRFSYCIDELAECFTDETRKSAFLTAAHQLHNQLVLVCGCVFRDLKAYDAEQRKKDEE